MSGAHMSICVEVRLLSGRTTTVTAGLHEDMAALKLRAQTALGVGHGRLVDTSGGILDTYATIKDYHLQNGDSLTLHTSRVQVCGTSQAFEQFRAMDLS